MYKITFEADVNGIASVKRYYGDLYVQAETPKAARDKSEMFIKSAYSDTFAVLEVLPISIIE